MIQTLFSKREEFKKIQQDWEMRSELGKWKEVPEKRKKFIKISEKRDKLLNKIIEIEETLEEAIEKILEQSYQNQVESKINFYHSKL